MDLSDGQGGGGAAFGGLDGELARFPEEGDFPGGSVSTGRLYFEQPPGEIDQPRSVGTGHSGTDQRAVPSPAPFNQPGNLPALGREATEPVPVSTFNRVPPAGAVELDEVRVDTKHAPASRKRRIPVERNGQGGRSVRARKNVPGDTRGVGAVSQEEKADAKPPDDPVLQSVEVVSFLNGLLAGTDIHSIQTTSVFPSYFSLEGYSPDLRCARAKRLGNFEEVLRQVPIEFRGALERHARSRGGKASWIAWSIRASCGEVWRGLRQSLGPYWNFVANWYSIVPSECGRETLLFCDGASWEFLRGCTPSGTGSFYWQAHIYHMVRALSLDTTGGLSKWAFARIMYELNHWSLGRNLNFFPLTDAFMDETVPLFFKVLHDLTASQVTLAKTRALAAFLGTMASKEDTREKKLGGRVMKIDMELFHTILECTEESETVKFYYPDLCDVVDTVINKYAHKKTITRSKIDTCIARQDLDRGFNSWEFLRSVYSLVYFTRPHFGVIAYPYRIHMLSMVHVAKKAVNRYRGGYKIRSSDDTEPAWFQDAQFAFYEQLHRVYSSQAGRIDREHALPTRSSKRFEPRTPIDSEPCLWKNWIFVGKRVIEHDRATEATGMSKKTRRHYRAAAPKELYEAWKRW